MTARRLGLFLALAATSACVTERPGPRVGEPAIEYVATTLEGDSVSLASLRGQVVLLNLWATWCAPCRQETPYLQSVFEEYQGEGLRVVGISLDTGDAAEDIQAAARKYLTRDRRTVAILKGAQS